MKILSSSELSRRNSDLSTGMEALSSLSYGKLLDSIQSKYLAFPTPVTYGKMTKLYHPASVVKTLNITLNNNLNIIKRTETVRTQIYEGNRSKNEI